jgi:hypothetical protein
MYESMSRGLLFLHPDMHLPMHPANLPAGRGRAAVEPTRYNTEPSRKEEQEMSDHACRLRVGYAVHAWSLNTARDKPCMILQQPLT